ncbi:MAG: glycine cleavage system protein H, partial [Moraxellaceae bacterium]|nr:glycine cleavage system protein H [Moraxellaceae bacterium]
MSNTPANLKYASSHEWALLEGDIVTVGISDHAQDALGDLVYVELPNVGDTVSQGDEA